MKGQRQEYSRNFLVNALTLLFSMKKIVDWIGWVDTVPITIRCVIDWGSESVESDEPPGLCCITVVKSYLCTRFDKGKRTKAAKEISLIGYSFASKLQTD